MIYVKKYGYALARFGSDSYCFTDVNFDKRAKSEFLTDPVNKSFNLMEVIMPIQEGKDAPEFSLPDANGKKVALKDFKGKNVIIYFYPKDDTPG